MKISRLKIQSAALVQLRYFYRQVIGFPVVGDDESILIYAGKSIIEVEPAPIGEYPVYHFAFNIPSNKIGEAKEWLSSRVELLYLDDYKSEIADFFNWNAKSLYFKDPAGNIVEFIARFDLHDDEEAPFSPAQIRYVSEIGIVFDNEKFDGTMEDFMKKYSLSYFDKQPPLPHFRAMGDDEGLIIAVPANREWYPTKNVYSTKAPVSVTWLQDETTHNFEWGFD
jgi:hypothetical protein